MEDTLRTFITNKRKSITQSYLKNWIDHTDMTQEQQEVEMEFGDAPQLELGEVTLEQVPSLFL